MVYCLIPTYNRSSYLKRALHSIFAQSYDNLTVYVINCGSTDGTSEMLRKDFGTRDRLYELRHDSSVWWTEAMSLGVTRVLSECKDDDFILSFNDDLVFSDQNVIARLLDTQRAVGPSLVIAACVEESTKRNISSGYRVDWASGRRTNSLDLLGVSAAKGKDQFVMLDVLFGRGTLIPVKCFRAVGNYNAKVFPQYGGDAEFSFRAQQAGWQCVLDRTAIVMTSFETTPEYKNLHRGLKGIFYAIQIPFSINSPKQICKGFKLIDLCCPQRYRLKNKIIYLMSVASYACRQCLKG